MFGFLYLCLVRHSEDIYLNCCKALINMCTPMRTNWVAIHGLLNCHKGLMSMYIRLGTNTEGTDWTTFHKGLINMCSCL